MRFVPQFSYLKIGFGIAVVATIFPASYGLHAFPFHVNVHVHVNVPTEKTLPLQTHLVFQSNSQFRSSHPSRSFRRWTRFARYNDDDDDDEYNEYDYDDDSDQGQPTRTRTVQIDTTLNDLKVAQLFAWISRALAGDPRYNDLTTALAAIFATVPELQPLVDHAMAKLPYDNDNNNINIDKILTGVPLTLTQREESSLGAMGAAQWLGMFQTRPHSLLDATLYKTVDEWVATLPRGCRRTLQRSFHESNGIVVTRQVIRPNRPAPHSSLAHFTCVVEHEMRLLASPSSSASASAADFIDAMAEAVGRFMGTTRMVGEIYEYRDATSDRVLAFSHQVRKGNTIRGQWFYATDEASRRYVWFRSVHELVKRAIDTNGIDIVDLGPSGSDAFSELKAKYGFVSVDDWTNVADYTGPFWYDDEDNAGDE